METLGIGNIRAHFNNPPRIRFSRVLRGASRSSVRHTRPFMLCSWRPDVHGKDRAVPRKPGAQAGHLLAAARLGACCGGPARGQDRHRRLHQHPDDALRPSPRPSSCRPSQTIPLSPPTSLRATDDSQPSDLMRLTCVHFVVLVENPAATTHQTPRTLPWAPHNVTCGPVRGWLFVRGHV